MWKIQEGEKPWKIALKTPIGTPDPAMCIEPAFCDIIFGFLFEEIFPVFMPLCELFRKVLSIRFREGQDEGTEFLSSRQFGSPGKISGYDLNLMELAELKREIWEFPLDHFADSASTVDGAGKKLYSSRFQIIEEFFIHLDAFGFDLFPQEILAVSTGDQNSFPASEKRGIQN